MHPSQMTKQGSPYLIQILYSNSTNTRAGKTTPQILRPRYDEYGNYFNMFGQPTEPPQPIETRLRKDSGSNMLTSSSKEMIKPQNPFFPTVKLEEPDDDEDFVPRRGDDYNHFTRNNRNPWSFITFRE
jgi:hypothetical protein